MIFPEDKISQIVLDLEAQGFSVDGFSPDLTRIIDFTNLILKWNNSHDLVSQKDFAEIFDHHIIDSIAAFLVYRSLNLGLPESYIDIGTGAGLPGIIWHICFNQSVNTVLVEPRIKRINFLKEVRRTLSLKNLVLQESRFSGLPESSGRTHVSLRALKPTDEMLSKICEASGKNNVFWLASEKAEKNTSISNLKIENHSYTIQLKDLYKRTLINFFN